MQQISLNSVLKPELFTLVLKLIQDAVLFAEGTNSPGQDKKTIAVEMAKTAYKSADLIFDFQNEIDSIVFSLIPTLVDGTVFLFNVTGRFKK